MARRMINASVCAYQVYDSGVVPTSEEPVLRQVEGPNNALFYDVVPTYQDAIGFPSAASGYAPAFHANGDDKIDAAFIGRTQDNYIVVSLRGTIPPSVKNDDLLECVTADFRLLGTQLTLAIFGPRRPVGDGVDKVHAD